MRSERFLPAILALLAACAAPIAHAEAYAAETVSPDGSAQFRTVQSAIDAAHGVTRISIAPGTYREKILIAKDNITLTGTGKSPSDVVLTYDDSAGTAGGTKNSYTLAVTGDNFTAYNLTIQNNFEQLHTRSEQGSQAVALMLTGDRETITHVRLLGYQDTLFATSKTCHADDPAYTAANPCHASRQLFQDCYIAGHVDFIFGDAKAVFDHCELHAVAHPTAMLTAQSRLFPNEDSGYLFLNCTVTADPAVTHLALGRPWRPYARVYFINTELDHATLTPEGWQEWDGKLATADYAEYNTGPNADTSHRVATSRQLTQAEADKLTVQSWLAGWTRNGIE